MKHIYLDYAAATPLDPGVLDSMVPFFSESFHNPSATYLAGQDVRKTLELARDDVARTLGVRSTEIIFTAGGTEANNLAIAGVMSQYPHTKVLVSAIDHKSVIEPAKQFHYELTPVQESGLVDVVKLRKQITDDVVLMSIGYVNNEIGTIQPIQEIAKLIEEILHERQARGVTLPLLLHSDACQAVNYLNVSPHTLGVDLMTLNGGKLYGPKQSGMLYVKAGIALAPVIRGGGQESGVRSGTENVAGIIGFAAALERAVKQHSTESKRVAKLRDTFIAELTAALPSCAVNGSIKHRIANNIHITVPGYDNERLMMELDERGIQCAVGSACSASDDEPSHVLKAIGLSDAQAQSSLRFTLGKSTTADQLAQVVSALIELTDG